MGPYPPRVALALRTPANQRSASWVEFHTGRGGIDPGNHRFRPWFVGDLDVWNDFRFGDGTLSCPGGAGYTDIVRGGIDPGVTFFVPRLLEL